MTNEEYMEAKKKGTFTKYIWRWSKDKQTPNNWLGATPIRLFGICLGWKVCVVHSGYEHIFFTDYKSRSLNN